MSGLKAFCIGALMLLLLGGCGREGEQTHRLLGQAEQCGAASQACTVKTEALQATLALGPDVKPLMAFPVVLSLEPTQGKVEEVVVDFQMQGMDMGMNRYRLTPSSPNSWEGNATLPVCTASRMDWLAIVEFTLDGQPLKLVYPFTTESN